MVSEPLHTMRFLLLVVLMLAGLAPGATAQVAKLYPVGYRAGFEKTNGRWRIFFFLAGD